MTGSARTSANWVAFLLFLSCAATYPGPVAHAQAKPAPGASHYVEFRVGLIGTYGHSYVAYGRLNAKGEPREHLYADLHPVGGYLAMAAGHLVPVRANTKWDPEVLTLKVVSSFRKPLTGAQYRRLVTAVRHARTNREPYWNVLTNNCNHFVAALARSIGMRVPANLQVSYTFIPALRALNEAAGPSSRSRGTP